MPNPLSLKGWTQRMGQAFHPHTCTTCGKVYGGTETTCPECKTPAGGFPEAQRQFVRRYAGLRPTAQMQKEANALAAQGWLVATQASQGNILVVTYQR